MMRISLLTAASPVWRRWDGWVLIERGSDSFAYDKEFLEGKGSGISLCVGCLSVCTCVVSLGIAEIGGEGRERQVPRCDGALTIPFSAYRLDSSSENTMFAYRGMLGVD